MVGEDGQGADTSDCSEDGYAHAKKLRKSWNHGNINLLSPLLFKHEAKFCGSINFNERRAKRERFLEETEEGLEAEGVRHPFGPEHTYAYTQKTRAHARAVSHSKINTLIHTLTHTYTKHCVLERVKGTEQLMGRIKRLRMSDQLLARVSMEKLPPAEGATGSQADTFMHQHFLSCVSNHNRTTSR